MRCARRVGCAAGVLAAVAAVAAVEADERCGPEWPPELVVVPRGGGVFVEAGWWQSCHMLMVGGGGWVPLRAERRPAQGLVLYRPTRSPEPGVVYQVEAMTTRRPDDDAACAYFGNVVAGAAVDRRPPDWLLDPEVVSTAYRTACLMDEAIVELEVLVADDSPLRLMIEARPRDGRGEVMRAVVRPRDQRARVVWPTRGERFLRTGAVYEATVCAEDAAGNRSCAQAPVEFTAPGPEKKPATEPLALRLAREVWTRKMVAPPPEERMQPAPAPERRGDWGRASAGAAGALVVLLLVAVARGRGYWGWWTRM